MADGTNRYNGFITRSDIRDREEGRLSSLTFAVKDNIDVKGLPTTAASRILRDNIAQRSARSVEKILREGGRITGKANMHEFAIGATTTSTAAGPCLNPRNPEHICGGSSGGSAALVASGEVDIALGTDTGGSVRLPASLCGVVGFKPTTGSVSDDGVVPLSRTLDTVGILGNGIEDISLVFDVIREAKGRRIEWAGKEERPRLGLYKFGRDEVSAGLAVVVNRLRRSFDVSTVEIPALTAEGAGVRRTVSSFEAAGYHSKWMDERSGEYFPDVLLVLRRGSKVTKEQYAAARQELQAIRDVFEETMKGYDALLTPAATETAPKIEDVLGREAEYRRLLQITELFNATGSPSISLPAAEVNGLPAGLMVSGALNDDAKTLAVARMIENVLDSRNV